MTIKFPLYAKILVWFFLNVVILCLIFLVLAQVQFKLGLDSLVNGPAGERIQTVIRDLTLDVWLSPQSDWKEILRAQGEQYHVDFYLFRPDGERVEQLAGAPVELPPEVRVRILEHRGPPPGGPRGIEQPPRPEGQPGFEGQPDFGPPPREGQPPARRNPPPKTMLHAAGRYWVIVPLQPEQRQQRPGPPPVRLPAFWVISSATLSAGGLFFEIRPWVIAGVAVVLVSALFWLPLVRGITRAVTKMTAATEQIAEGRFDVRSEVRRQDELGSLSDAINGMAVRLAGFVTGQKRFLGDIAHELCSPIARIQVALGILEQRADEKQKAQLNDLREEVDQISGLVNELLSFSKASLGKTNLKLQRVPVREIVERAIGRECGPNDGAKVEVHLPEDLCVVAEPELLLRAVANVLRNAVRYAAHAGPITVAAERREDQVMLTVEDSGPGNSRVGPCPGL